MLSRKDFKVAVVGGGMCGLACGVVLARAGIHVDIFEAAPKFDEVGAGVDLGPNAVRVLKSLGLLEAILTQSYEIKPTLRPFTFLSGVGSHEHIHNYPVSPQDKSLGIYRPAFIEALLPLLPSKVTHFNKRCTSISTTEAGNYLVHFADGATHEADCVVGADGIRSVVRCAISGDQRSRNLVFTNKVAYRGLIPIDVLKRAGVKTVLDGGPLCWVGMNRHIITFPIKGKQILYFNETCQSVCPLVEAVSEQELLYNFQGWGSDAMTILHHLKKPSKWSLHAVDPPLSHFVKQKIVLVGDAAHAMEPHLGAGVGQGLEDVFVLCKLLTNSKTQAANLHDILQIYDGIRTRRANMVLERSNNMGNIYEGYGPDCDMQKMQRRLTGMWEPVWHYDPTEDIDAVLTAQARL